MHDRPGRLGRFVVIASFGEDGDQWLAYDDALERRVVVELFRADSEDADARREAARAMASLDHRNVAQVYEVGEQGELAFVAHELPDGRPLREWQAQRSVAEIVDAYAQVVDGLAAAHDAGVVHGSWAPERAIIGEDGRVRVIDFGRPSDDGRELSIDEEGDQRSVRDALRDAVSNPPTWLRRALDPAQRHASMHDLAAALRADPGSRRRVLGVGLLAAAALASAFGWQQIDRARKTAACEANAAVIDEDWNDERRAAVRQGLLAVGFPYAEGTAEAVMPWLDEAAANWRSAAIGACTHAEVDRDFDAPTVAKAQWCLDDHREDFRALVRSLSEANETVLGRALTSASTLGDPSWCAQRSALATVPDAPPTALRSDARELAAAVARLRILRDARRDEEGLDAAQQALTKSEALGWKRLEVEASLLYAVFLALTGSVEDGLARVKLTYFDAAKAGLWDLAADAAREAQWLAGSRQGRFDGGHRWAEIGRLSLVHAGDTEGEREALRVEKLGFMIEKSGRGEESLPYYERVLELREALHGPDHPIIGAALMDLSNAFADHDIPRARAYLERAEAIWTAARGTDHPQMAVVLGNLGLILIDEGELAEAQRLFERALAIAEKSYGDDAREMNMSLNNLGWIHFLRGDYEGAEQPYRRLLALDEAQLGDGSPNTAIALLRLAVLEDTRGNFEAAAKLATRGRKIWESTLSAEHGGVVYFIGLQARAAAALGDAEQARALAERVVEISDRAMGPDHYNAAQGHAVLGDLASKAGDHDAARQRHERAVAIVAEQRGEEHIETAQFRGGLGRVLRVAGQTELAIAVLTRALDLLETREGDQPGEAEIRRELALPQNPP